MKDDFFNKYEFDQARLFEIISKLTKNDVLDTTAHSKGFNVLHAAAYYGLDDFLLNVLEITAGDGLNIQDKKGRTPIHHLASNGRDRILLKILERYKAKLDIEQVNYKGRTALHSAAKHLHSQVVKLLLEVGHANADALDIQGNTPLSLSYHRHFPGEGILFVNPVVDYLLSATQYWQKQPRLEQIQAMRGDETTSPAILSAWCLGMNYASDPHWIPGIQLTLSTKTYTVQDVYSTDLTQFVMLKQDQNNILLCLDRIPALQKSVCLTKHVEPNYLHTLRSHILPLLADKDVSQIWGTELAGIDAQWLASNLPVKQLLLINSPGLPDNLLPPTSAAPVQRHYFFASQDSLHLSGKYAWSDGANFYTNAPIVQTTSKTSSLLQWALMGLKQQASLHQLTTPIKAVAYTPGQSYLAPAGGLANTSDMRQQVTELFDNTMLSIESAKASHPLELVDFARYEYCAHGLAYLHLLDGHSLVKWWDSPALLPMQRIVHHQGLYCYLLQHEQELVLNFQGTDPGDFSSISRDLDRGSAGIKRIRQQYFHIIQALACTLNALSDKVKLVICGHSLGGADAQNFFTIFLASLARFQSPELSTSGEWNKFISRDKASLAVLQKISEVHLYAYNGAGIRNTTAGLAKISADKLKDVIKITVNHQRVYQDIVNTVGETTLHDFNANTVTVRSLFFDGRANFIDRIKTAHTDRQFFSATIGNYELHQGAGGQAALQLQLKESGKKIEPNAFFYHKLKQVLQKGNVSDSFSLL